MTEKIIFDTGSMISLSESCMFNLLKRISEELNIELIISREVEKEVIKRPIGIKRFELSAVRVRKGVKEGWIKVVDINKESNDFVKQIEELANSLFYHKKTPIKILQRGELEAIALLNELNANVLAVDERTTRMILEEPDSLRKLIQRRQGKNLTMDKTKLMLLKKILPTPTVVRSCDLVAWAFKHKLLEEELMNTKEGLESALYAVKFKGCSVSFEEIDNYLKVAKLK